jgi:hypothetical protein
MGHFDLILGNMKTHHTQTLGKYLILILGLLALSLSTVEAKKDKDKNPPGNSGGGNSAGGNSGGGNSGGGTQIGAGATQANPARIYLASGWNVNGDYTVVGPTILVIDGDLDIGNNTIDIAPTGSLQLYVSGDITVNGNGGINNQGIPANLLAFGTHPSVAESAGPTHSWTLSGNSAFTGVIYAPNAEYRTNGGGSGGYTSGSVVALKIRFNGSPGPFHFDEALTDLVLPFGGYSMSSYELLRNGSNGNLTAASTVFGSTDYDALFKQLYP